MIPFRLVDARSAAHAVALLVEHGPAAQLIAAGGDLLDLLKEGVVARLQPSVLVNLATAGDLAGVSRVGPTLRLGAMTTLADVAANADVQLAAPMLVEAISRVASPQLRNMTTVAGNLLQRSRCLHFRHPAIDCFKKGGRGCPAAASDVPLSRSLFAAGPCRAVHPSDLVPVLAALDAEMEIVGPAGVRTVPIDGLYAEAERMPAREAAIGNDEVVVAIALRAGMPRSQVFEKLTVRGANDFALASVAVALDVQDDVVSDCRIVLGGVALRPMRCIDSETLVVGRTRHAIAPGSVADAALRGAKVPAAVRTLVSRALARALGAPA